MTGLSLLHQHREPVVRRQVCRVQHVDWFASLSQKLLWNVREMQGCAEERAPSPPPRSASPRKPAAPGEPSAAFPPPHGLSSP